MSEIIVSYSEVFKWQTCQRQYFYRFIRGLSPINESDAIHTGVTGHKLLEHFYVAIARGDARDAALELVDKTAKKYLDDNPLDFGLLKSWALVTNYIRSKDNWPTATLVENRFLIPASKFSDDPVFENVQIGFTPDVVFEKNGFCEVEDAKFVGKAWGAKKINRFSQAKLYQIFLKKMGYNVTRSSIRFFNTTTNVISAQNYTLGVKEGEILIRDFLAAVAEVVTFKRGSLLENAPRTMNYTTCQFCQFEFPCGLEAEGKSAEKTLNQLYVKSTYDYRQ